MTPDIEALVERLRHDSKLDCDAVEAHDLHYLDSAADALVAQAARIEELEAAVVGSVRKLTLEAMMARHGLHAAQRHPYYDGDDRRVDPLQDREAIAGFLGELDAALAGEGDETDA